MAGKQTEQDTDNLISFETEMYSGEDSGKVYVKNVVCGISGAAGIADGMDSTDNSGNLEQNGGPADVKGPVLRYMNAQFKFPVFSGSDNEDPREFLRECEHLLKLYEVRQAEWASRVMGQLRGEARNWWSMAGSFDTDWGHFVRQVEARFDNDQARAMCLRTFYCRKQDKDKSAEQFIYEKLRMIRQLGTSGDVSAALPTIVEQLLLEFRPFKRTAAR
ncbi:activity-regulated cytoskeleton-associated protein-like [Bacillus rossius redtenbacheri]|uniref:activity-regulated cytoskeleton-associated protein-like n=1 Tax=Bacillus rossius redtenbacheri TaxID=93214 RepID=UPI002FDDF930